MKKYTCISCNEHYVSIVTQSLVGNRCDDPLGEEFYLELDSYLPTIGDSVLKALSKSRDLSISDEDRECYTNMIDEKGIDVADKWFDERYPEWKLFDNELCDKRYHETIENMRVKYDYKTKSVLLKNMQMLAISCDTENETHFKSWQHKNGDHWSGGDKKDPALEFAIPSLSSVEVVGAAAKYAIGNCRGKGADLIREILFPEGQPETFEEYLKELGL